MQALQPSVSPRPLAVVCRALVFVAMAAMVTFALFVLMDALTRIDETQRVEPTAYVPVQPFMEEPELEEPIRKALPEPPKVMTAPEQHKLEPIEENSGPGTGNEYHPVTPGGGPGMDQLTVLAPSDASAVPVLRIEPKYPMEAARDGIEGWVKLSFDINALGQVENVQVLDAEPARIFDREARRALLRWKYKAKVVEGRAIRQTGQRVMLSFNLSS